MCWLLGTSPPEPWTGAAENELVNLKNKQTNKQKIKKEERKINEMFE